MGVPRHAHWLSSNSSVINHLVGEESSKIQGINECDYFVIQELQFLVCERLSVGGFFFFIALMIIETITYIDRDSASATFVLHNFSLCVLCGSRWCSAVVMVCARSPRCGMGGDTCATSCFVARTRTHPITLTHTHADDATAQRHSACLQRAPSFRRSGKLLFRADLVLFRCPRSRLATPARPPRLVRASGRAQGRALEGCVG